jgi:hypothetical protein
VSKQPVKITGEGVAHRITVGGHDISDVTTALSLEIDASTRTPVLTLTLLPVGLLDAGTEAIVRLGDKTAEVLKALGWTPPEAAP